MLLKILLQTIERFEREHKELPMSQISGSQLLEIMPTLFNESIKVQLNGELTKVAMAILIQISYAENNRSTFPAPLRQRIIQICL